MADNEYTYNVYGEELYAETEIPQDGEDLVRAGNNGTFGRLVNVAGAVASLALVVGVGVWGYKLMVRDVSGVPVVRAIEGPMRVTPEDPGGQLADHQGLAVNAVAAQGSAAAPAERLALAPRPVGLTAEDVPMAQPQDADAQITRASADDAAVEAFRDGSVDALVRELTDGVAPLSGEATASAEQTVGPEALDDADSPVEPVRVASIDPAILLAPGVKSSPRPLVRPASLDTNRMRADVAAALSAAQDAMATTGNIDIEADALNAGTRLAQLGAYDSPEIARAAWDKLYDRFGDYMDGKKRVVQKASSGGRTFYRLRAMGFEDLSDARRFCSALVAENADCIPVTVR